MPKKVTEHASRSDMWFIDPRELVINLNENSRAFPPTDEQVAERAASILTSSQLQPIVVRKDTDGQYHVCIGFTRALAGMKIVNELQPCALGEGFKLKCITSDIDAREAFVRSIDENLERNNTSPIDDAMSQRRLREEFGWTEEQIAKKYKVGVAWVGQMRKLLILPLDVKQKVHEGLLSVTHAINLADLTEDEQREALKNAIVPVADERKENKVAPQIDGAKLTLSVRKKKAANGKRVGRSIKEVRELFGGLTGPGEHPSVKKFAEVVLEYIGSLSVSEKRVTNALERVLNADPKVEVA